MRMAEREDWIDPPELLIVSMVLGISAAAAVLPGVEGIATGSPFDTVFVAIMVILVTASVRMRLERPGSIRFAALAARLSSLVWLWLLLKIESPGTVVVAFVWIAVAICLLSARGLLRFVFPDEHRLEERLESVAAASPADRELEGWIEEVAL